MTALSEHIKRAILERFLVLFSGGATQNFKQKQSDLKHVLYKISFFKYANATRT